MEGDLGCDHLNRTSSDFTGYGEYLAPAAEVLRPIRVEALIHMQESSSEGLPSTIAPSVPGLVLPQDVHA